MYEFALFGYALYVLWIILGRPPVEPAFWFYLSRDWQRAGKAFGLLGLDAELCYYDAMKRKSLAV